MEQVIIIKKEHGMQNCGEEEADKKHRKSVDGYNLFIIFAAAYFQKYSK